MIPPDPKPAEQVKAKRDGTPRAPRRGALTLEEAMTVAQQAVPGLRACTDVPRVVTADLEIVRGRGVVTALNRHTPCPTIRATRGTAAPSGASRRSVSPRVRPPGMPRSASPSDEPVAGPARIRIALLSAVIAGRVAVESGVLPPASVCVVSAAMRGMRGLTWLAKVGLTGRCESTAEDGTYRIEGLLPGSYVVSAGAEGYLVVQHQESEIQPWVRLEAGQVREGLTILLRVRGVPIRGVVRDVSGGVIAGALVIDDKGARAMTTDDGGFTLWAMSGRTVVLSASANGYTTVGRGARPPQGPVTFWLTPESVLRGQVVQGNSGAPIEGAAVHLHEDDVVDAETASDGSFEVRGLEPGNYQAFVRSRGVCGVAEPVALGLGETSDPVTINVRPCRTVTGRVVERPSGKPCAAAEIEVLDATEDVFRRALTDSAGAVTLSGVEPGAYQVRIGCPGHIQRAPEPWTVDESMQSDVVWSVETGRVVRGVVLDPHGSGAARAHVSIVGEWGHVAADADDSGQFTAVVQPGSATITPYHPRWKSDEPLAIDVAERQDPPKVVVKFSASHAGEVHGRVRPRSGVLPEGGVTVVARAIGNLAVSSARTDEEGRYSIAGLERIQHEIIAQQSSGVGPREDSGQFGDGVIADLNQHDSIEVNLAIELPDLARLAGRVEDDEGHAEIDALVTVRGKYTGYWRTVTDEQGRFEVQVPDQAGYSIDVTARSGATVKGDGAKPGDPVTLRLVASRQVCGVVGGGPGSSESIKVTTDRGGEQAFQAGSERWCLAHVPVGKRTITARSLRFGTVVAHVVVPPLGEVPEVILTFSGRGSLRGRVLDGAGHPRYKFKVWVFDNTGRLVGGNRFTDEDGNFTLDGVPNGEVSVVPMPPGPMPRSEQLVSLGTKVSVQQGQTVEVVLTVP